MQRRTFLQLAAALPLVVYVKPSLIPESGFVLCQHCEATKLAVVHWPVRVIREGTAICAGCGGGDGIITQFWFDVSTEEGAKAMQMGRQERADASTILKAQYPELHHIGQTTEEFKSRPPKITNCTLA